MIPLGDEFLYSKTSVGEDYQNRKPSGGKVFYIENLPGELFSMGDVFLYDTGALIVLSVSLPVLQAICQSLIS